VSTLGEIDYRKLWNSKPGLRAVYSDIYQRMLALAVPGPILEIGGGSGNFKSFVPSAISTDIVAKPWLDLVCDAQRLPLADESFANIVMVDVLHHVEYPVTALREACRVLRRGGRLIFCEPAITAVSSPFYRYLHPEPVDMSANPLATGSVSGEKDPWDSNQAIPTLLVGRYRQAMAETLPALDLVSLDWFSFLAYPLSGGFRDWSLLPAAIAPTLLSVEWRLRKLLGPLAAFRLLAAYQKSGPQH
jgi:SAM-dependent methyltransferase